MRDGRVQAFFAFYMYAGRLFHGPTFMSRLDLHPNDPRFPTPCLLHAMCAIGSLYTAEITATPIHTDGVFPCTCSPSASASLKSHC